MRGAHRRSSSGDAPRAELSIAPELSSQERAAALARRSPAAPAGVPLDAQRLDAARNRLRAAAALAPAVPAGPEVDLARFDAAQQRLRTVRRSR